MVHELANTSLVVNKVKDFLEKDLGTVVDQTSNCKERRWKAISFTFDCDSPVQYRKLLCHPSGSITFLTQEYKFRTGRKLVYCVSVLDRYMEVSLNMVSQFFCKYRTK